MPRYLVYDVFTETPFGGNQLAVFPEAEKLPQDKLQKIAREFNFSETTFVYPPENPAHTAKVRIFTPTMEVPFAGHPTIGTAVGYLVPLWIVLIGVAVILTTGMCWAHLRRRLSGQATVDEVRD